MSDTYYNPLKLADVPNIVTDDAGTFVKLYAKNNTLYLKKRGLPEVELGTTGAGSTTVNQVTLDFGSIPVYSKGFTLSAVGVNTGAKIMITPAADSDEYEMDGLVCSAYCKTQDNITVYVTAVPGPITGQRNFNYIVG